jgi:hypothetical protein
MRTFMMRLVAGGVLVLGFFALAAHLQRSSALPDSAVWLQAPPFISVASAAEPLAAPAAAEIIQKEAGISAYFKADSAIPIDEALRNMYRTVEDETDTYIIGSMAVEGYSDWWDVHVYVHTDGWVLAYYGKDEPTSKIFDALAYDNGTHIPTILEKVLGSVASFVGAADADITYYHFQYPNATNMMLVADYASSFEITLPSGFSYLERSWIIDDAKLLVNEEQIGYCDGNICFDTFTTGQLLPGNTHTVGIYDAHFSREIQGMIAIIYTEE